MSTNGDKKTVVRFNEPGHAHFLTFSCYKDMPLLSDDRWKPLLTEAINNATRNHAIQLLAFVYMPEHVHLLVYPTGEKYDISVFLSAVKRPFSFRVKKTLEQAQDPLLRLLMIRDRPNARHFRFWQEGGGHDHNVLSLDAALVKAQYIHNNPVRRGLAASPEQWKWSSWLWYQDTDAYDMSVLPEIGRFPC